MRGSQGVFLGGMAAVLFSSTAFAQSAPPVYSWQGQYIGIHGGYEWVDASAQVSTLGGSPYLTPFRQTGGHVGIQTGYLYHLSRNWVAGYEVDLSIANIQQGVPPNWAFPFSVGSIELKRFGTARTRFGYAHGPWLIYATGGLAWGWMRAPNLYGSIFDHAQGGFVYGGGLEYAFAPNWSARIEYLATDLGDSKVTQTSLTNNDTTLDIRTVRLGLNYRFANWDAPNAAQPVPANTRTRNWSGPYFGLHAGQGWGEHSVNLDFGSLVNSFEPSGRLFGFQSGYNWQLSDRRVVGIESDYSYAQLRGSEDINGVKIRDFGTVRLRTGYASSDAFLYATGGAAWLRAQSTAILGYFTRDQYYLGWTVGGGLEYALSPRWSAKLEYLYSELGGKETIEYLHLDDRFRLHTVKLGLNYRTSIFDLFAAR